MKRSPALPGYAASLALVAGTTLVCEAVRPYLSPVNMVMAYLLAVVLAALQFGLRSAIATAAGGVLAFDFFFVPPRFTFMVAEKEFLGTFLGLFVVGVVIGTLVNRARERAEALRQRESEATSLYHLSRDLAAAADQDGILQAVQRNVEERLQAHLAVFLPHGDRLEPVSVSRGLILGQEEQAVAHWSYLSRRIAGQGSDSFSEAELRYVPLRSPTKTLGVLGIRLDSSPDAASTGQTSRLLEAYGTQIALALERVELSRQAEQAQIMLARENLERALLNSISHDLRTPLVTITGVLSSVLDESARLADATRRELLETAQTEADRLNRFVGNLLDMTRLEAGAITLKRELCEVQELIGCALSAIDQRQGPKAVSVDLPEQLPLVAMDLVLMTQVLVNLLDNALKYSPGAGSVEIAARQDTPFLTLEVSDHGPGVPETELPRLFDKFYRVPVPEGASGTGLGLSICRGIVEAHGGTIRAENLAGGGLRVTVQLPIEEQDTSHDP